VSKHFTTGMPKCRNAEMRKTPFGVGFGYRELECRNTSPQECRNAEMRKTPFGVGCGHRQWSCEREELTPS
jgi:hypothetical protein